jgi:hypothetical protein
MHGIHAKRKSSSPSFRCHTIRCSISFLHSCLNFEVQLYSTIVPSYSMLPIHRTCTLSGHYFSAALLQIQMKLLDLIGAHASKLLRAFALGYIIFMRSAKLPLLFTGTSSLQTYFWMTIWCQNLRISVYRGSLVTSKLEHALQVVRKHSK